MAQISALWHLPVRSYERGKNGFRPEIKHFCFGKTIFHRKGDGANFCFIAPSSEELGVRKEIASKLWTTAHGVWPESEDLDSGKKEAERPSQEEQNGAHFCPQVYI